MVLETHIRKDKVRKSVRWMPRHLQPKKDAIICEKPRGVENRQRSGGIRMGEPAIGNAIALYGGETQ